ncbi:bifunctional NUDIX hydrolase/phosphatase PAP2 family protein [Aeromonas diversa]|uniref:bifunctional NUDIX hydrolase/phosphatase PAP2 family protein n=1 Tax=Aeromonas diversa TaxID=502790 RepID=UPI003F58DF26
MVIHILLIVITLLAGQASAASPTAAVCVVQHQNRVVMVKDSVSGRFGLTGGYVDGGETPQQAALRELYEETGLKGEILSPIGQWNRAMLFACRTLTPLQVTPQGDVNLLHAPNLGGEIRQARLINPAAPEVELRFPEQTHWLATRLPTGGDSQRQELKDFSQQGNLLHRAELPWLERLQTALTPLAPLLAVTNLFGEQALYLVLLPLLLPWLGWPRLRAMLFTLGALAFCITLSKLAIGWPRPFHLMPQLAEQASGGFGMPSGHTATALLFWGLLLRQWQGCRQPLLWALLAGVLTGLARLELGVHFISDVLAGLLLGGLLLGQSETLARLSARPLAWWTLSLLALALAWPTQSNALMALASLGAGLSLGQSLPLQRHARPPLPTALLALVGSLLCGLLQWQLPYLMSSSLTILLLQWASLLLLGLWLSAGIWLLSSTAIPGNDRYAREEA